ncbi:MAG: hypothetical protein JXQ72_02770 [Anaerolineae bacterium]|nr:hypothetical protein [Anaerolineae bacterium]
MRRLLLGIVLVMLAFTLAACGGDDNDSSDQDTGGTLGLFEWDHAADAVVVRLDSRPNQESPAFLLNSIPPCTVWGDGRVVWVSREAAGEEAVLEARIDDATLRGFVEDIINRGFYDWEDELLPPTSSDPIVETMTISLYDEVHTVRRYTLWPQKAFTQVLAQCQTLSDTPVRVEPKAGWISAYPVPQDNQVPNWDWPLNAPFTLAELAENGEARWLEGDLATLVWRSAREDRGDIQVVERGGEAYQVAIAVPGYSRDAAAPPEQAAPAE